MKKLAAAVMAIGFAFTTPAFAENDPAKLNDLQLAHVAYTADNLDIRYAHLALAKSSNPEVIKFAKTMIRDHEAVNEQALALLAKLGANPEDNFLSKQLNENGEKLIVKMSGLSGAEFDKFYAQNELDYHKAVNGLMVNAFIPNIENAEVKALFEAGLKIFLQHESHAEKMVKAVNN